LSTILVKFTAKTEVGFPGDMIYTHLCILLTADIIVIAFRERKNPITIAKELEFAALTFP